MNDEEFGKIQFVPRIKNQDSVTQNNQKQSKNQFNSNNINNNLNNNFINNINNERLFRQKSFRINHPRFNLGGSNGDEDKIIKKKIDLENNNNRKIRLKQTDNNNNKLNIRKDLNIDTNNIIFDDSENNHNKPMINFTENSDLKKIKLNKEEIKDNIFIRNKNKINNNKNIISTAENNNINQDLANNNRIRHRKKNLGKHFFTLENEERQNINIDNIIKNEEEKKAEIKLTKKMNENIKRNIDNINEDINKIEINKKNEFGNNNRRKIKIKKNDTNNIIDNNKFDIRKNLNIDTNNINNINFDNNKNIINNQPMIRTADNSISEKIEFNNKEIKDNKAMINKKIINNKNILSKNENNIINSIQELPNNSRNKFRRKINEQNFITFDNENRRNFNINNEIKVQKEKKDEIKVSKKNNEDIDDDINSNLNINNLIQNKQNKAQSRNINVREPERRIVRSNTLSNLNSNINKTPQNIYFLFDQNLSIFDSIMLILNHNYHINQYLIKNQNKILICEKNRKKNNKHCLISILYYMNEYLWIKGSNQIKSKYGLQKLYQQCLNSSIPVDNNSNKDKFLSNLDNLEMITNYIYNKINGELTIENMNKKTSKIYNSDIILCNFLVKFSEKNKSVISDFFTGFYQESSTCFFCMNREDRFRRAYTPVVKYNSFNYIFFDLNPIINSNNNLAFCNSWNQNNLPNQMFMNFNKNSNQNNMNPYMNIYDCFCQKFNQPYQSPCDICNCNNIKKLIRIKIYTLPKVLTIILNNPNANFIINDKINLSQYVHTKGNHNFYLTSILCKYTYDNLSLILYCFNHKDSNWYSYKKREGNYSKIISRASYLDMNAIPYLLIYQNEEENYEYNNLNLDIFNNKIGYNFKFMNKPPARLFFGKNSTVKEVCKEISSFYNFEKVKLLINGEQAKEKDKLKNIVINNNPILVYDK